MNHKIVVIGNVFDNYFALAISDFLEQKLDMADMVSLKVFANSEFCPRFTLNDNHSHKKSGHSLENSTVIIISVHNDWLSRNELAMRNLILARAAKDNGAARIILTEPDLFFSAQDRGPRKEHGQTKDMRPQEDFQKFDGQAFTSKLYAQLLKTSGVDTVITVHNHSYSCQYEYNKTFGDGNFINLLPDALYHSYLCNSGIVDIFNTVLVAPDEGAIEFVKLTAEYSEPFLPFILFEKKRKDERTVSLKFSEKSQFSPEEIEGKDIVVLDDMVRTGSTILKCCHQLKKLSPRKIIFAVTHFLSSDEIKRNLADDCIDEIVTTNSLPTTLNRDHQGRLRKKMAVLKINKWIANYLNEYLELGIGFEPPLYLEDMSVKNPRSRKEYTNRF